MKYLMIPIALFLSSCAGKAEVAGDVLQTVLDLDRKIEALEDIPKIEARQEAMDAKLDLIIRKLEDN